MRPLVCQASGLRLLYSHVFRERITGTNAQTYKECISNDLKCYLRKAFHEIKFKAFTNVSTFKIAII
jgi:hypothetical protein